MKATIAKLSVDGQHTKNHAINFNPFTEPLHLSVVTEPIDGAEAIETAEVRVDGEIREGRSILCCNFQGPPPRRHAMDPVQVRQDLLEGQ